MKLFKIDEFWRDSQELYCKSNKSLQEGKYENYYEFYVVLGIYIDVVLGIYIGSIISGVYAFLM